MVALEVQVVDSGEVVQSDFKLTSGFTRKLAIASTLRVALMEVGGHWRRLLSSAILPAATAAAASVGVRLALPASPTGEIRLYLQQQFCLSVVHGLAAVLVSVCTHRILLMDAASLPNRWGIFWTRRELAFSWRAFLLYCALWGPLLLVMYLAVKLPFGGSLYPYRRAVEVTAYTPMIYVVARLSLVLPAIATDRPIGFRDAWLLSEQNGIRLTVVLAVMPLALHSLRYLWSLQFPPSDGTKVLLVLVLGIFEIAVLSCAYRLLSRLAPD